MRIIKNMNSIAFGWFAFDFYGFFFSPATILLLLSFILIDLILQPYKNLSRGPQITNEAEQNNE